MRPGGDLWVEVGGLRLVHHNYPGRVTRRYQPGKRLVFLPLAGEIEVGVGPVRFSCGPGRLVYVPAGEEHSLRSSPKEGERLIALISPEAWRSAGGSGHGPAAPTASPLLREIFFFLLLHPATDAASSLAAAAVQVLDGQLAEARSFPCMDVLEGQARDPRLQAAVRYMRERLGEPVSMKDVASAAALSVRSLTRLFAAEFGRYPKGGPDEETDRRGPRLHGREEGHGHRGRRRGGVLVPLPVHQDLSGGHRPAALAGCPLRALRCRKVPVDPGSPRR